MNLPYSSSLVRQIGIVLTAVEHWGPDDNFEYDGSAKIGQRCPSRIPLSNKYLVNLIADNIENGMGYRNTTRIVNGHQEELGLEQYSFSAVWSLCQRIMPKTVSIEKRTQGSTDVNSDWCKASFGWALQLLIHFGKLNLSKLDTYNERLVASDDG